ncbi:MAG: hypothetical protein SFX72_11180 [Isosphaeraceae bacterium]|nr:hypothetical protein [Isosphaeraceae bacterium]
MTTRWNRSPRRAALGLSALLCISAAPAAAQDPARSPIPDSGVAPPPPAAPGGDDLPPPIERPIDRSETREVFDLSSIEKVSDQLFQYARAVASPGERALALARIARSAAYSGQLGMAHTAVMEGGEAAKLEPIDLVHDQRLDSVITAALQLAEERTREPILASGEQPTPEQYEREAPKRREQMQLAAEEWRYAAELARSMRGIVQRTEASFRVVDAVAFSTQALRGMPVRTDDGSARIPAMRSDVVDFVRRVLTAAADEAERIERPVWRDRALVSVAQNAAAADQFDLAIQVARRIPQPEIRTDAFLRIAENQAENGRNREATEAYSETARTIAMIPLDDPREVLTGVLIDSLISLGRFEDARAAVVLYSNPERRTIALAAVAESQGKRGLGDVARRWIADQPAEIQPLLYRKVSDGMLTALQTDRSKDSGGMPSGPTDATSPPAPPIGIR